MTLAKARAKASAKAKHIHNTGVNYDRHLQLSKYFYGTDHRSPCKEDTSRVEHIALFNAGTYTRKYHTWIKKYLSEKRTSFF